MMRNVTIAAAALLAVGLSAGPASAQGGNVCYLADPENGDDFALRLNVKPEGPLSRGPERPRSVAYSVYGKIAEPTATSRVVPISGSVVVGVRSAAVMELTAFSSFYGCDSSEASSTPRQWACDQRIVSQLSNLSQKIILTRVDPRREELCRAAPTPR